MMQRVKRFFRSRPGYDDLDQPISDFEIRMTPSDLISHIAKVTAKETADLITRQRLIAEEGDFARFMRGDRYLKPDAASLDPLASHVNSRHAPERSSTQYGSWPGDKFTDKNSPSLKSRRSTDRGRHAIAGGGATTRPNGSKASSTRSRASSMHVREHAEF
ncbi:hypothetical protein NA57DRAFT_61909 [Rhizodiscina lignyota]|uniref:Uncharacterized protein n=1 Tax=Rhizodiscina lignyota TaxID=1504668 RepID=A0A9P4I509_9PEZI|nr:hypothetical protein NA57DRAFT_61909 [Rhizodiscina lignyota]